MKKKLSDYRWSVFAIILSITGLLITLGLCLYSVTISRIFGEVNLEIPIAMAQFQDPTLNLNSESNTEHIIDGQTPILIMTEKSFMLGTMDALTRPSHHEENISLVKHIQGEPDLGKLKLAVDEFKGNRSTSMGSVDTSGDVLVLYPTQMIPMPIVIQVVHYLRSSRLFAHVVLAGGGL